MVTDAWQSEPWAFLNLETFWSKSRMHSFEISYLRSSLVLFLFDTHTFMHTLMDKCICTHHTNTHTQQLYAHTTQTHTHINARTHNTNTHFLTRDEFHRYPHWTRAGQAYLQIDDRMKIKRKRISLRTIFPPRRENDSWIIITISKNSNWQKTTWQRAGLHCRSLLVAWPNRWTATQR